MSQRQAKRGTKEDKVGYPPPCPPWRRFRTVKSVEGIPLYVEYILDPEGDLDNTPWIKRMSKNGSNN